MIIIVAIVVLIALSAESCNPEPCCIAEPGPGPDRAPLLVTGDYRVQVVAVQSVNCRGAEPGEFEGQVAWGFLDADRAQAGGGPITFDLEGVRLDGTMQPGWLSASGSLQPPEYDETEVSDVADTGDFEDPSTGSGGGSTGGGSTGHSGGGGHAEPAATAALDVQVMSTEHAEGTLAVVTGECNYTVVVRMDLGAEQEKPPVDDTGVEHPVEPEDDTAVQNDTGDASNGSGGGSSGGSPGTDDTGSGCG